MTRRSPSPARRRPWVASVARRGRPARRPPPDRVVAQRPMQTIGFFRVLVVGKGRNTADGREMALCYPACGVQRKTGVQEPPRLRRWLTQERPRGFSVSSESPPEGQGTPAEQVHDHIIASSWSGRPDSNWRPSPWQGDALPTEPRPRGMPSYQPSRHRATFNWFRWSRNLRRPARTPAVHPPPQSCKQAPAGLQVGLSVPPAQSPAARRRG